MNIQDQDTIVDDMACKWSEDEDGNWSTGCHEAFVLIEGTPRENRMKFCCYCGKSLKEVPYFDPPTCDICGAEITTGMMAVFCPRKEACEFWPEDIKSQEFILEMRDGKS